MILTVPMNLFILPKQDGKCDLGTMTPKNSSYASNKKVVGRKNIGS